LRRDGDGTRLTVHVKPEKLRVWHWRSISQTVLPFKACGRAQGRSWLAASRALQNLSYKRSFQMAHEKGLNGNGQGSGLNDGRWREPPPAKAERNQQKQPSGLTREPPLNPSSQRQENHISDYSEDHLS